MNLVHPEHDLHDFFKRYGKTRRLLFLHPYMLEYVAGNYSKICPLQQSVFNDDSTFVMNAKKAFLTSPTFQALTLNEQLELIETLGVTGALYQELFKKPWFRKLLVKHESLYRDSGVKTSA